MGEPLPFGKWKKAPSRNISDNYSSLIHLLKRAVAKCSYPRSSNFTHHHNGMWGVFQNESDARHCDLLSNFVDKTTKNFYPTIVVKCEIKGKVHKSSYNWRSTYLASHIKIVEELQ